MYAGSSVWSPFLTQCSRVAEGKYIHALTFDDSADPTAKCLVICTWSFVICFLGGEVTRNFSQVDKLWSVLPCIYAWIFAYCSGFNVRCTLMALLATVWGARLTYNFSRRGGYDGVYKLRPWQGEEDYRWPILRGKPPLNNIVVWMLFDLVFISFFQNVLLLLLAMPSAYAYSCATNGPRSSQGLTALDYSATGIFLVMILISIVADQQQWVYQQGKKLHSSRNNVDNTEFAVGFCRTGLWGKSRHPNYFAEQGAWISFYVVGMAASGIHNSTVIGALLLCLVFQGSTRMSEAISAGKYKLYKDYQNNVPCFMLNIFRTYAGPSSSSVSD